MYDSSPTFYFQNSMDSNLVYPCMGLWAINNNIFRTEMPSLKLKHTGITNTRALNEVYSLDSFTIALDIKNLIDWMEEELKLRFSMEIDYDPLATIFYRTIINKTLRAGDLNKILFPYVFDKKDNYIFYSDSGIPVDPNEGGGKIYVLR